MMSCLCGEDDCMNFACDYPWCRPCHEHHRPPECDVDDQGRPLMSCGCAWEVVEAGGHRIEAHYAESCYIVRERNELAPTSGNLP